MRLAEKTRLPLLQKRSRSQLQLQTQIQSQLQTQPQQQKQMQTQPQMHKLTRTQPHTHILMLSLQLPMLQSLLLTVKALAALAVAIVLLLPLTGCLRVSAEDLYQLPQVSQEYLRLQAQINTILGGGAEFSPPTGGPNRQAVQLKDLNSNGVNEVLAFFSIPGESTLKIYIFEMIGRDYAVAEIIDGVGSAFESVRYSDMDGDGSMEIIVGWQMGVSLKYFSVFSTKDFRAVQLVSEEYSEITLFDISSDGKDDLIAIKLPLQEAAATATLYILMPDGEIISTEARLSNGIDALARIQTGHLLDNAPALFVESEGRFTEGVLVTDVLAFRQGAFANISISPMSSVSDDTVRSRTMYSSDITKDGIVKTPIPRLLKAQSETPYYVTDWYAYRSDGAIELILTTYHNNFDEWYLILPASWRSKVSVRREDVVSGERTVIFSFITGVDGPYEDFLKIYKLLGDRGEERANLPGRVVLMSEGSYTYAYELVAPSNSFGLAFDDALIRENFRLIYSDWLAGARS